MIAAMARIDYEVVSRDYIAGRGLEEGGLAGWREAVAPYLRTLALPLADVGSGTGQFAPLFARWFGIDVIGVEPSEGMRAQAMAANAHPRVTYLAGDAARLPFDNASCGAAWLSTMIHHVPDLAAAAREIRRVLADGAPVLIRSAFPGRTGGITLFRYFPEAAAVVETFPAIKQVERAFGAAGFTLEHIEAVPQVSLQSLGQLRERVALRADTTLRGISDHAFARGLERIDEAISAGRDDGPFVDYLDLVVLR